MPCMARLHSQTQNAKHLWENKMGKTPYEIRLDVLKMAQEMLEKEKSMEEKIFSRKVDSMMSSGIHSNKIHEFIDGNAPKSYNENELVTRSSALYSFISENK